jgi:hypothetical protein
MHMDWYDRSILSFVLDTSLLSRPTGGTAVVNFGMDAGRIGHRFDAILDVYGSHQIPLEDTDLELLARAVNYRVSANAT